MKDNKISVIIPTMNRYNSLIRTLDKIYESNLIPDEIIIVDQSTDIEQKKLIINAIKKLKRNIKYLFQEKPSLTRARNKGFEIAKNEIIVCMDDDVDVKEDTFLKISNIMLNNKIAMIAGIDLNSGEENSKLGYIFGKKSYKNRKIGHITGAMFSRLPKNILTPTETQWAMGFFFVIRRSLVIKWNMKWDEKLVSYGYPEDLDFSYQYYLNSKKEGFLCILHPDVEVYHLVSNEWRSTKRAVTFMFVINREYLSYKFGFNFISRIQTRWANFGIFIERLLKNDNYWDVIVAQYYCDKFRKDIKNGNIHTELYMKG